MKSRKIVENLVEIANNASSKIPHKWSNIQAVSIKTPDSVALPVYSQTPQVLKELGRLTSVEDVPAEEVLKNARDGAARDEKEDEKNETRELTSPLLRALKKQKKRDKGEKKGEKKKDNRIVEKSVDVNEGPKKRPREERERFDAKKSKSRERQSFIPSKTYARMPGYVFKVGPRGLGHYLDVQMTVNQAALDAILRVGKGKSNSRRRKTRR